ncbi:GNAT family N-acetyltransferase [Archaeoglobus veneficus]|uniref:GNAT family N-acetyltransferase n=1 Tax=Archaeoglobus veneficus TaxID=58290 RepID=UPI00064F89C9|nr:GNAT family N-acetyltransferase [Archaeoglobus veneficus]
MEAGSTFSVDFMENCEVEEVIHLEYDVLGTSPFANLSLLPVRKRAVVAKEEVDAEHIVGCATVCWAEQFVIASIAVRDDFRGKGVGKAILRKCIEFARDMGYDSVWLETPADGPVDFYLKEGFRVSTFLRNYYGDGIHGLKLVYTFQF